MQMGNGEVLWRPLNNAAVMRHQRFGARITSAALACSSASGISPAIRDLFNSYQDVPSVWVEPHGQPGARG